LIKRIAISRIEILALLIPRMKNPIPELFQHYSRIIPELFQNYSRIIPELFQNYSRIGIHT
jgi:hypothetical protein